MEIKCSRPTYCQASAGDLCWNRRRKAECSDQIHLLWGANFIHRLKLDFVLTTNVEIRFLGWEATQHYAVVLLVLSNTEATKVFGSKHEPV
jgi:hypothetical protein